MSPRGSKRTTGVWAASHKDGNNDKDDTCMTFGLLAFKRGKSPKIQSPFYKFDNMPTYTSSCPRSSKRHWRECFDFLFQISMKRSGDQSDTPIKGDLNTCRSCLTHRSNPSHVKCTCSLKRNAFLFVILISVFHKQFCKFRYLP